MKEVAKKVAKDVRGCIMSRKGASITEIIKMAPSLKDLPEAKARRKVRRAINTLEGFGVIVARHHIK